MEYIESILPGGYLDDDGKLHQQVALYPLRGAEEKLIAQKGHASQAALVTTVLSQCIRRIGTIDDVTEEIVRNLLVGDRQVLLLKLREITFGQRIQAVINCSWPDCGKQLDIDFSTENIPVTRSLQKQRFYEMTLSEQAGHKAVTFRLPNGHDQERIAHLVEQNKTLAEDLLLSQCIQSIGPLSLPEIENIAALPALAKTEIEQEMDRLAPKISLTMEAFCPECERKFSADFDLQEFILRELHTQLDLIFKEVHYLAYHYHWSEKDILGMTRENRRRYIEILSDEIERINHAT